jgi:hypothetical protein
LAFGAIALSLFRGPRPKTSVLNREARLNTSQTLIKSTFVNGLAWIFIVLSGFATLMGILQNILVHLMFSPEIQASMQASVEAAYKTKDASAITQFMLRNFKWIFLFSLIIPATLFISSIGLLKRKNWARLLFIAIMAFGIFWNICGFVLNLAMFPTMSDMSSNTPPDLKAHFATFSIVTTVIGGIIALGISILLGWIIKRLISPDIKQEFQVGP